MCSSDLPRQRFTERTVHIMNQNGLLRSYLSPNTDSFATACTSEARVKICGEIFDRLKWRASRKAILKLWVSCESICFIVQGFYFIFQLPKPAFANLIFAKVAEDHLAWTITKPKIKRINTKPSTTTLRAALSSSDFIDIFGLGSDVKRHTDQDKLMFITKIFNTENDVVRISYCITTGMLSIRFVYKIFQLNVDPVSGIIEYLEI